MPTIVTYLGIAGIVIETLGVLVIILGFILSTAWYVTRLRHGTSLESYQRYRQDLGRSIMLGLEFLIAGDIIRTIVIEQTLNSAATLAVIVAIRIILSLTLEYEVEGRTPWQSDKS
jgi:uncharacterized membrane protein